MVCMGCACDWMDAAGPAGRSSAVKVIPAGDYGYGNTCWGHAYDWTNSDGVTIPKGAATIDWKTGTFVKLPDRSYEEPADGQKTALCANGFLESDHKLTCQKGPNGYGGPTPAKKDDDDDDLGDDDGGGSKKMMIIGFALALVVLAILFVVMQKKEE